MVCSHYATSVKKIREESVVQRTAGILSIIPAAASIQLQTSLSSVSDLVADQVPDVADCVTRLGRRLHVTDSLPFVMDGSGSLSAG